MIRFYDIYTIYNLTISMRIDFFFEQSLGKTAST